METQPLAPTLQTSVSPGSQGTRATTNHQLGSLDLTYRMPSPVCRRSCRHTASSSQPHAVTNPSPGFWSLLYYLNQEKYPHVENCSRQRIVRRDLAATCWQCFTMTAAHRAVGTPLQYLVLLKMCTHHPPWSGSARGFL